MKIRLNPHRHCAGFLFTSSKSTTQNIDERTAASEGSLAVGPGAKYMESGSLDLSGSANAELGPKLSAGGDLSITSSDPGVISRALEQIGDLSRSQTSAFSSYAKQLQEEKAGDLATLLTALGQLEQQTGQEAQQKKFTLSVVLAVLALLGVLGWVVFRRK